MAFGSYYPGYQNTGYQQNPYQQNPYQQLQFQQYQPVQPQPQIQPMQQAQPQIQQQSPAILSGQMVDCIDAVKAKDVDMTGAPTFYPNINGLEIYRKQLQPDGTCQTVVYRKVDAEQPVQEKYVDITTFNNVIEQMQDTILNEIDSIKGLIARPSRGGVKND